MWEITYAKICPLLSLIGRRDGVGSVSASALEEHPVGKCVGVRVDPAGGIEPVHHHPAVDPGRGRRRGTVHDRVLHLNLLFKNFSCKFIFKPCVPTTVVYPLLYDYELLK